MITLDSYANLETTNSEMQIKKLEAWNGPSRPPYLDLTVIVEFSLEFSPPRVYPEITKRYDLSAHKTSSSLRSISLIIIVATGCASYYR